MSHFSVMAIGQNPTELLAPFHEFECTGKNDQFVKDVDITDEVQRQIEECKGTPEEKLARALEYHGLEDRVVLDEDAIDRDGKHKRGYAMIKDGKLVKAVQRTNPDAKWDWWVIGGRWGGSLLLKNGEAANSAKIEDIDFDTMNEKARNSALDFHDKLMTYVAAHPTEWEQMSKGPRLESLLSEIGEHNKTLADGEKGRDFHAEYWTEERKGFAKSLREAGLMSFFGHTIDDLLIASEKTREEYAEIAMSPSWQTYAAVRYGAEGKPEWTARGEMGWFGMSDDSMTTDEWAKKMRETVSELPGDTLISIIDCHI